MKMVDWIVEIYYNYKTSDNTFFTTINIMDRFFFNTNIKYTPDDLQLIGMCSVFIASKFCEIYPIKLKFLIEKIGYNKYNKEQILKMEENILSCLNYDILRPTLLDFCNYYLQEIFNYFENNYNIKSKILYQYLTNFIQNSKINLYFDNLNYFEKFNDSKKFTENYQKFFRLVVIYLLKMCCHDYDIINEKISLISASCIIVAFKITGQINNEKYINKIILDKLINMSKEDEITLITLSEKILKRAQNYQKYYNGINNLYRTHFETLNYVQNTK
jgi:cyclin B